MKSKLPKRLSRYLDFSVDFAYNIYIKVTATRNNYLV